MKIKYLGGTVNGRNINKPNHRKPTAKELDSLKSDDFKLTVHDTVLFVDIAIGNSVRSNSYRDIYRIVK